MSNTEKAQQSTILTNTRQVHIYLRGLGWKCAYNTVAKDIKDGKLVARRGGGFTRQTVDQYAMTHLTKRVDADPGKDSAWSEPVNPDAAGAQERRVSADADLKEVEAKRKRFLFERERGKYVQTSIIGRELAERWQAVRLRMGSFCRELSGEICELFGGEPMAAGEVIKVVDGDPDRTDGLQRFCLSRREELSALFRDRTRDVLSAFADDTWLTEDMATAWEKYEQERKATEIASMRELIARVGGDETRAAEMVERYRVQEIAG